MSGFVEPLVVGQELASERPANLWRDTFRNILRQRSAIVGLAILGIIVFIAIFASQIAPFDSQTSMLDLHQTDAHVRGGLCIHLFGCTSPTQHLMGQDGNARDEFSRIVFGSRVSFEIGFLTVGLAIFVGTLIGAVAGFLGGVVDNILMRLMDVMFAFPALLLAIAIVNVLGTSLTNAMLAVAIVAIPVYARVMRASVMSVRDQDFVIASRALGESQSGLLLRRVLPNALTPLIVQATLGIGSAIIDVAALSFLGLGADPSIAEWGSMIGIERNSVFAAPHLIIFPGLAIVLMVLAFNLLGDGVRDALDPRLNR